MFGKLDKINTLAALELNHGNVSQTAKEFGVNRGTIYKWLEQMENDVRLLAQVEAAKKNLANLEELQALKANAEISRRLDENPAKVATKDLISIKDSGIKNSRLIRGESTANIGGVDPQSKKLTEFIEFCLSTPIIKEGIEVYPSLEQALWTLENREISGVEDQYRLEWVARERQKLLTE